MNQGTACTVPGTPSGPWRPPWVPEVELHQANAGTSLPCSGSSGPPPRVLRGELDEAAACCRPPGQEGVQTPGAQPSWRFHARDSPWLGSDGRPRQDT